MQKPWKNPKPLNKCKNRAKFTAQIIQKPLEKCKNLAKTCNRHLENRRPGRTGRDRAVGGGEPLRRAACVVCDAWCDAFMFATCLHHLFFSCLFVLFCRLKMMQTSFKKIVQKNIQNWCKNQNWCINPSRNPLLSKKIRKNCEKTQIPFEKWCKNLAKILQKSCKTLQNLTKSYKTVCDGGVLCCCSLVLCSLIVFSCVSHHFLHHFASPLAGICIIKNILFYFIIFYNFMLFFKNVFLFFF